MLRNKYFWVITGTILALLSAGGAYLYVHNHNDQVDQKGLTLLNNNDGTVAGSSTGTGNSIKNNSSGGLAVGSGSPTNLGQLGGSSGSSGGSGSSGQQSPGGSSNAGAQTPSPDTFSQYEKYKDSPNALFGEIKVGDGAELTANKTAAVAYKGWLTSGQMFDATKTNNDGSPQPFVVTLGAKQVIPGFEQGIAGMKVGGSRLIIIPPSAGYGATAQNSIPANSVLVFEVKLLSVQ